MTPQEFVHKWKSSQLKERAASQEHFLDLCHLVGHPTPASVDSTGESFTFEKGTDRLKGSKGFADVWKKGFFGWEYKGKHKNLDAAYDQLLTYREALQNPPLLIVSDMERIVIHTNFTNTVKRVLELSLDDLLTPDGFEKLKALFYTPDFFRSEKTTEGVTADAAAQFATLSAMLRADGVEPDKAAHFLIRLLFCLFAEDVGLLPESTLKSLIETTRRNPDDFARQLGELFRTMATGGYFGLARIAYFNGALFDDATTFPLNREALDVLDAVSRLDWGSIEPSIFGTLFERSLDPAKRSQLGAHYTSKEDILLIVEPVLMRPLRRQWEDVRAKAEELVRRRGEDDTDRKKANRQKELTQLLVSFAGELGKVTVLDPACGSGNFLYVALRQLLDLEKEVIQYAGAVGVGTFAPSVTPSQLHGIEINPYAHELASATIWIGYIQWLRDNGFGFPPEPILRRLDTIENRDAVLEFDADGKQSEPDWPAADVVIGNPPFLGDKKMRAELGGEYVAALRKAYSGRVPGGADLVCYWFEKARHLIARQQAQRAGFIATNSIRIGRNREVLDRIANMGQIFDAWSDRDWILDGAAVRVSMVAFDDGTEHEHHLDGTPVEHINTDLTSSADLTSALPLPENDGLAFLGMMKAGPFDITSELAEEMLAAKGNPNGRPNSEVVRPRLNGKDIVSRSRGGYIIDFADVTEETAAGYELPFEYVRQHVKPLRDKSNDQRMRVFWWLHGRSRPALRAAISGLRRCIITPEVAKHRIFAWIPTTTVPDHTCHVIARDDDYFFGVLHSRPHELWSLAVGNWMGVGNDPRYNSGRIVSTYPFPFPPGKELTDDPRVQAIAAATKELVEKRDRWLNPEGATDAELKKRTLTNLYNERPTWLDLAHKKLDNAVFDAYGWPHDLTDEQILERLLALNLERAKGEPSKKEAGQ